MYVWVCGGRCASTVHEHMCAHLLDGWQSRSALVVVPHVLCSPTFFLRGDKISLWNLATLGHAGWAASPGESPVSASSASPALGLQSNATTSRILHGC